MMGRNRDGEEVMGRRRDGKRWVMRMWSKRKKKERGRVYEIVNKIENVV